MEVTPLEGEKYTGRITSADEDGAELEIDGQPRHVDFGQVRRAVVQIEMNRKSRED